MNLNKLSILGPSFFLSFSFGIFAQDSVIDVCAELESIV